jgi:hypothetical protein
MIWKDLNDVLCGNLAGGAKETANTRTGWTLTLSRDMNRDLLDAKQERCRYPNLLARGGGRFLQ